MSASERRAQQWATHLVESRRTGMRIGGLLAGVAVGGALAGIGPFDTDDPRDVPDRYKLTLTSLGSEIKAAQGNYCGRAPEYPNGPLGCTRACARGHATRERLPVRAGGLLRIRTLTVARQVFVRLSDGVSDCGTPIGRAGPDIVAERDPEGPRWWRLRLPDPLVPHEGIGIVVTDRGETYPRGTYHYYARIRPARGTLVVRQTMDTSDGVYTEGSVSYLRLEDARGEVVFERGYQHRLRIRLARRLPPGRYRLTSYQRPCNGNCEILDPPTDSCSARLKLRDHERLVARIRVKPSAGCSVVTAVDPEHIEVVASTNDDRRIGVALRRYLRRNASGATWYRAVTAIQVEDEVIVVATGLRPSARGNRVARVLCNRIQGSDVADFVPGHTIVARNGERLRRCPARHK